MGYHSYYYSVTSISEYERKEDTFELQSFEIMLLTAPSPSSIEGIMRIMST